MYFSNLNYRQILTKISFFTLIHDNTDENSYKTSLSIKGRMINNLNIKLIIDDLENEEILQHFLNENIINSFTFLKVQKIIYSSSLTMNKSLSTCYFPGFLIGANIFCGIIDDKSIDKSLLMSSYLSISIINNYDSIVEKQVSVSKILNINDSGLILLSLNENIGDELGFISISNIFNYFLKIIVYYINTENQVYIKIYNNNDSFHKCKFIFTYHNSKFYLTQIGDENINDDNIKIIDKFYKKSISKVEDIRRLHIDKNNKLHTKRYNLNRINSLTIKDDSLLRIKSFKFFSEYINLDELIIENSENMCLLLNHDLENLKFMLNLNITKLEINNCNLNSNMLNQLSKINFPNLKYLQITNNNLSESIIEFFTKINLSKIVFLDLNSNNIEQNSITFLLNSSLLNLIHFDISNNNINDETFNCFSNFSAISNLFYLNIRKNRIGNDGVNILTTLKFEKLQYLNITDNTYEREGFANICHLYAPKLKILIVNKCYVTSDNVLKFSSISLPQLRYFSFKTSNYTTFRFSDDGVAAFSNIKFPFLEYLNLDNLTISKIAVIHIFKMNIPHLEYLNIDRCRLEDKDLLYEMNFPKIKYLYISDYDDLNLTNEDKIRLYNKYKYRKEEN